MAYHTKYWIPYAREEEARFKEYWICVYFNEDGIRVGCDCSVEIGEPGTVEATLKLIEIPREIHRATLLWSGSTYRDSMSLTEFLAQVLL